MFLLHFFSKKPKAANAKVKSDPGFSPYTLLSNAEKIQYISDRMSQFQRGSVEWRHLKHEFDRLGGVSLSLDHTGGLVGAEVAIMDHLVQAWELYRTIEQDSESEGRQLFRQAIHLAQYQLMNRVLQRLYPHYWH